MTALKLGLESQDFRALVLPFPKKFIEPEFASLSEYALSRALEKYVKGWQLIVGETFQIPIANKQIDFRVGDTFVEHHPLMISHEFENPGALTRLLEACRKVHREEKNEILLAVSEELATQYYKRRKEVIKSSPKFDHCSLIVTDSAESFYHKVMVPFGHDLPTEAVWMREHQKWKKEFSKIRRQNE